jgi:hypothetical protein
MALGPMTSRPSTTAPILPALAIAAVPLILYVAGYFWLGDRSDWHVDHSISLLRAANGGPDLMRRSYPQQWLTTIYTPAGWVEEQLLGIDVEVTFEPSLQTP